MLARDVLKKKEEYPQAKVLVHPECRPEVVALADQVLGTGGMITYVQNSENKDFIIGTEIGVIYRLRKENPSKRFIPLSEQAICHDMKRFSLEKILWSLKEMAFQIRVSDEFREKARGAVEKMLRVT